MADSQMPPSPDKNVSLSFQTFLDTQQYTANGILRYERVFGKGFVSTGGMETTQEFVESLNLQPGQLVLDVGCGIGGGDFYMAENFGTQVLGIDLSQNMISFARAQSAAIDSSSVKFEVQDCTKVEFPDASFDVIYSRDTILHIQDKRALFARFYKWLKPGGRVLISDYCRAPCSNSSAEFLEYIRQRGYDLRSVEAYGELLRAAGFVDVVAEDRTEQFVKVLKRELAATEKSREKFVEDFSAEDYECIVSGWESKLKRCSDGEQQWGLFVAHKPV